MDFRLLLHFLDAFFAMAGADAAEVKMVQREFGVRCPLDEECKKGWLDDTSSFFWSQKYARQTRGFFFSEEHARQAVFEHLVGSPVHDVDDQQAMDIADRAEVESWEIPS